MASDTVTQNDPTVVDVTTESAAPLITIEGIQNSVVEQYFETLNRGQFEATAALFAEDGALLPPFEKPIVGPTAIAAYLQNEAKGFNLQPRHGTLQDAAADCVTVEVVGKVQTPLFSVNVSWQFVLNPQQLLMLAKIKLLASPKELLALRSS